MRLGLGLIRSLRGLAVLKGIKWVSWSIILGMGLAGILVVIYLEVRLLLGSRFLRGGLGLCRTLMSMGIVLGRLGLRRIGL
jgi:hypothetical protein